MKAITRLLVTAFFVAAANAPVNAITIRADRQDSAYRDLAVSLLPQTGRVDGPGWLGSGTQISPAWVLTAGHVAEPTGGALSFSSAGGTRSIIRRISFSQPDIGLLQLSAPLTSYTPAKLYNAQISGLEAGKDAMIAGAGYTGTGITGATSLDGIPRAGQTRIYLNGSSTIYGPTYLLTLMRHPNGGPIGPAANLEAGNAGGDSGGGVFLKVGNDWSIAGVLSQAGQGVYDSGGVFARTGTQPVLNLVRSYVTDADVAPRPTRTFQPFTLNNLITGASEQSQWTKTVIPGTGDATGAFIDNVGRLSAAASGDGAKGHVEFTRSIKAPDGEVFRNLKFEADGYGYSSWGSATRLFLSADGVNYAPSGSFSMASPLASAGGTGEHLIVNTAGSAAFDELSEIYLKVVMYDIYGFGGSADRPRFSNPILSGQVSVVPEPAVLSGLAVLVMFIRVRQPIDGRK